MASYYLLLVLFMLSLLLLLKSKSKSLRLKQHYNLPPGPWTLPIIGSIHHFIGKGLPHQALRDLSRKYGGLMFLQLGEHPTVVVSSAESAKEFMKTHDLNFCSRPVNPTMEIFSYDGKDIAFAPYGEYWREMRKVCLLHLFSSKRVQSFRSIREEEVMGMIKHILSVSSAGNYLNLSDTLLCYLNDITLRAIMGSKSTNKELLLQVIQSASEFIATFNIANLFPSSRILKMLSGDMHKAKQYRRHVDQLFEEIITEHRKKTEHGDSDGGLLSILLRLYDEDSENGLISMDSIKAVIFDVFSGGSEITKTVIEWAMAELMKNQAILKKAQTKIRQQLQGCRNITESDIVDLQYNKLIIKETLRLHPPAALIPRECRETCNILGYDIPKGAMVFINAWAIGKNSNYWNDPEEFKPERFADQIDSNIVQLDEEDFSFIPFGGGRRKCPGVLFGSVIAELVLANLLYHFDWELPHGMNPDDLDMTEIFGSATSKKTPLLLRAVPYQC